jgi:hypothetical protein
MGRTCPSNLPGGESNNSPVSCSGKTPRPGWHPLAFSLLLSISQKSFFYAIFFIQTPGIELAQVYIP